MEKQIRVVGQRLRWRGCEDVEHVDLKLYILWWIRVDRLVLSKQFLEWAASFRHSHRWYLHWLGHMTNSDLWLGPEQIWFYVQHRAIWYLLLVQRVLDLHFVSSAQPIWVFYALDRSCVFLNPNHEELSAFQWFHFYQQSDMLLQRI